MELAIQQKRTSKRRRDILDASLRCFMRHGVEAATIEQIREASGASSGSIYHHFGSKQAIAIALYVEGQEELASVFRTAMTRHTDPQQGIRAILRSYFSWVADHRDWALYLLRVATADITPLEEAAVAEINRRMREDLEDWLRPFVERGAIIALPAELYASLVFGAATHYARHWLVGRLTIDLETVVEQLAAATWRALDTRGTSQPADGLGKANRPAAARASRRRAATSSQSSVR